MIEMGVDNGILAKIRGDDISAGGKMLPPAGPLQPPELSAVVDTRQGVDHISAEEQRPKEDGTLVMDRLPRCCGVPI